MASSAGLKTDDIHSATEAMKRASLSRDPSLPGSDAQRGVNAFKSEQRKANAEAPRRATEGLFRAICSTDLLFLIDTTGSMGGYINAAKDQIRSIVKDIGIAFLNDAKHRTRCVIHIADAPAHGRDLHDWPDSSDKYPNPGSEPHRLTYAPLINQMIRSHINYALLCINYSTDRMVFKFSQDTNKYHSAARCIIPDEPLETGQPQWNTPGWLNETLSVVGFTSDAVVHTANTLDDMMASDDNITMREMELTIHKRQHPFAQGSQRTASYAGTAASSDHYVVKSFKRPGSRLPRLAEDMQCQALCKSFALEFNAVLGGEHLIDFIATACFKGEPGGAADDGCISLGAIARRCRRTAQAFSHFTFERSRGQFLVADLQGVNEMLTDPAMHTLDSERFNPSSSNLGEEGFKLELKTSEAMIRSGRYEFREAWPCLADSVCCSNMLCGKILLRADANESAKYPQCHWCDTCWPQLEQFSERRICRTSGRRSHEFEVSRFFYESQGQRTPLHTCSKHGEENLTAAAAGGEGEESALPIAVVAEGEFWDNMRSADVTLEYAS
ncbi:hypothetical protein B0H66DRAFT_596164 [Apodospora peruviana]|uniref:Alpha-type protein kinase domain-containing protein n=1 Tax=Apodospora peruviana TaxID=516989 RepID=A0AAE0HSW7_9PEZI|nr:hypothetical protein B0H66DRAFT_596164 [Apodospora peruviana]